VSERHVEPEIPQARDSATPVTDNSDCICEPYPVPYPVTILGERASIGGDAVL
jgi:hypothetical protein